tara:strand:+ start:253 stop:414 length:162 start_codon:yes stop_codon:yes gene_type:complete
MNGLVLTKKRIKKAERHAAQFATFKKGVFISYNPSVFCDRQNKASQEVAAMDP